METRTNRAEEGILRYIGPRLRRIMPNEASRRGRASLCSPGSIAPARTGISQSDQIEPNQLIDTTVLAVVSRDLCLHMVATFIPSSSSSSHHLRHSYPTLNCSAYFSQVAVAVAVAIQHNTQTLAYRLRTAPSSPSPSSKPSTLASSMCPEQGSAQQSKLCSVDSPEGLLTLWRCTVSNHMSGAWTELMGIIECPKHPQDPFRRG